jgi:hypothetical protein
MAFIVTYNVRHTFVNEIRSIENMQEALVGVAVLIIGVVLGSFFKPTEAQLRPLSPDQIKGSSSGHAEESAHHH